MVSEFLCWCCYSLMSLLLRFEKKFIEWRPCCDIIWQTVVSDNVAHPDLAHSVLQACCWLPFVWTQLFLLFHSLSTVGFHNYFDKKVADIRATTSNAAPPEYIRTNCAIHGFQPISPADVVAAVCSCLPNKQCATDQIPRLLKEYAFVAFSIVYWTLVLSWLLSSQRTTVHLFADKEVWSWQCIGCQELPAYFKSTSDIQAVGKTCCSAVDELSFRQRPTSWSSVCISSVPIDRDCHGASAVGHSDCLRHGRHRCSDTAKPVGGVRYGGGSCYFAADIIRTGRNWSVCARVHGSVRIAPATSAYYIKATVRRHQSSSSECRRGQFCSLCIRQMLYALLNDTASVFTNTRTTPKFMRAVVQTTQRHSVMTLANVSVLWQAGWTPTDFNWTLRKLNWCGVFHPDDDTSFQLISRMSAPSCSHQLTVSVISGSTSIATCMDMSYSLPGWMPTGAR